MKKTHGKMIIQAVLLVLAAVCLIVMLYKNNQAMMGIPIPQTFSGEYSWDGETWLPLDEDAGLSALDGDLFLRGHFSWDIPEGARLNFYLNHIGYSLSVNGEFWMMSALMEAGLMPSVCGKQWDNVISPGITTEDEIEIHLHNPHAYGNKSAYRDFLNTLYNSMDSFDILEKYLEPYCKPFQATGWTIIVVSLMILGAAIASVVLHDSVGGILWKFGLLAAFAGGFIVLDTVDFSFSKGILVMNTYSRQLCMMFFVFWLGLCAVESVSGRGKKVAEIALAVSAVVDGIMILLSFTGIMVIYDTGIYWVLSQVILCPLMFCCCGTAYLHTTEENRIFLASYMLLFVTVILDIIGIGASMYSYGTCTKLVFVLLFVFHIIRAVLHIVRNRQAAERAKSLEKELEDSRISIMLSQMQPHFLYNVLNTIYHLCGREPETAQDALSTFSDYLRNNMGALEQKTLIPFDEELRHIKTYLQLEKIRFGEELSIEYDLASTDFFLPVLTVQPLVENAVKHGIGKKRGGGTVKIITREYPDCFEVEIIDNGVGFDESDRQTGSSHVGIRNVRWRLENMVQGTLEITGKAGEGTVADIRIPRKEIKEYEYHSGR